MSNRMVWFWFVALVLVVAGAFVVIAATVLELDHRQQVALSAKQYEADLRVALWRLDSVMGPIVATEAARPWQHWQAFVRQPNAFTVKYASMGDHGVLVPSPLLTTQVPFVTLHFQVDSSGTFTSPQLPRGNERDVAEGTYLLGDRLVEMTRLAAQLQGDLNYKDLHAAAGEPPTVEDNPGDVAQARIQQQRRVFEQDRQQPDSNLQQSTPANEMVLRQGQMVYNSANSFRLQPPKSKEVEARVGSMQVTWSGARLVMVRSVEAGGRHMVQGCLFDWPMLEDHLQAAVADLFPEARLVRRPAGAEPDPLHSMASIPVDLQTRRSVEAGPPAWSPARSMLLIVGACIAVALAVVAGLLKGTLDLSQRRAGFVSAVTHELRTPLTTFRMYTELLAEDMVRDESDRRDYHHTLYRESLRLEHLVENALAYSRLEKQSARPSRPEDIEVGPWLDQLQRRLAGQAERADTTLEVHCPDQLRHTTIHTDGTLVEQVLSNLVDNACKYGRHETEPVRLEVTRDGTRLHFQVIDHGPGIPRGQRRRIFKPFVRGADQSSGTTAGVGLGLALCRRLADRLGGMLTLESGRGGGACFVLTVPTG